jgi:hypothetical protein
LDLASFQKSPRFRHSLGRVVIVEPMSITPAGDAPAIKVPAAGADHPSWRRVGIIAAIGFIVGIGWPRIFGVKFGPIAPDAPSALAAQANEPASASASNLAPPPPAPTIPAAAVASAPAGAPTVAFGHGFVLSCKTADGDTLKAAACGPFGSFESVAAPRLKKLEKCPAADGISGKLAVVLTVDFDGNHIAVDIGKATTIPQPDPLMACVKTAFQGAAIGGLDHEHTRYSVLYTLTLTAPTGATATADAGAAAPKEGDDTSGQVTWETALVRDAPKSGQIVARLPRGAKVEIGPGKDNWYKIKYGTDMASEGYVYRGAIGK